MHHCNGIDQAPRAPMRAMRLRSSFAGESQWIRHRPVAVVHIDLEEDGYQEIMRKLDLWEEVEFRREREIVAGRTLRRPEALPSMRYSPSQNSTT